ncbi:hypothetical protein GCM10010503_08130 [Streptomyces lucensis JCM 4490]|uniref:Uncharacterized protein n=1 Tax=Streptomyces lucensis JCM 4490 TaxID=1306176 RepID=A0A918MLG2_9ACTN|nr:hypothetical protein GCM10010503_08130 [Streptomyces lucensis JCM 4490]
MSSSGYGFDLENGTSFEWLTGGRLANDSGKAPQKTPERLPAASRPAISHPIGVRPRPRPP